MKKSSIITILLLSSVFLFTGCFGGDDEESVESQPEDLQDAVNGPLTVGCVTDVCVNRFTNANQQYRKETLAKVESSLFSADNRVVRSLSEEIEDEVVNKESETSEEATEERLEEKEQTKLRRTVITRRGEEPVTYRSAMGVKWSPEKGYVESVRTDESYPADGYVESLGVYGSDFNQGYLGNVYGRGTSYEGYLASVPEGATPDNYLDGVGGVNSDPGYLENVGGGPISGEGYLDMVGGLNSYDGYIESIGGSYHKDGYLENLGAYHGVGDGYLDRVGGSNFGDGYLDRVGGYYSDGGYLGNVGGGSVDGYLENLNYYDVPGSNYVQQHAGLSMPGYVESIYVQGPLTVKEGYL